MQQQQQQQQQMMMMQQQQQQEEYMRQQMMMAEQERQRQEQQQWMQMQQQQAQMQQLQAQPTGYRSNNPFAPGGASDAGQSLLGANNTGMMNMSNTGGNNSNNGMMAGSGGANTPIGAGNNDLSQQPGSFSVKTKDTNPELAALFANREGGLDTFGNVGSLRVPVGSGFHDSNRTGYVQSHATGTNPFARQQQQQQQQQQGGAGNEQPFFQI